MNEAPASSGPKQTVTIKKYANRRLYNTATSSYVTLDNLSHMVKEGIEFNVYDAKTSEDITRSVLTQIIVEEEGKAGQNLLPISFLRQLIGFYGDNMQWLVPKYLEHSMQSLSKNQEQIRNYFQTTFGGIFPFGSTFEEMGKQNMAMFERAMRMFSPFGGAEGMGGMMQGMPGMSGTSKTDSSNSSKRDEQEKAEEDAFNPAAMQQSSNITPMPMPATNQASQPVSGEDVQSKIAALQRQLAEMAKK